MLIKNNVLAVARCICTFFFPLYVAVGNVLLFFLQENRRLKNENVEIVRENLRLKNEVELRSPQKYAFSVICYWMAFFCQSLLLKIVNKLHQNNMYTSKDLKQKITLVHMCYNNNESKKSRNKLIYRDHHLNSFTG